jgi:hypothetical protein
MCHWKGLDENINDAIAESNAVALTSYLSTSCRHLQPSTQLKSAQLYTQV